MILKNISTVKTVILSPGIRTFAVSFIPFSGMQIFIQTMRIMI